MRYDIEYRASMYAFLRDQTGVCRRTCLGKEVYHQRVLLLFDPQQLDVVRSLLVSRENQNGGAIVTAPSPDAVGMQLPEPLLRSRITTFR